MLCAGVQRPALFVGGPDLTFTIRYALVLDGSMFIFLLGTPLPFGSKPSLKTYGGVQGNPKGGIRAWLLTLSAGWTVTYRVNPQKSFSERVVPSLHSRGGSLFALYSPRPSVEVGARPSILARSVSDLQ